MDAAMAVSTIERQAYVVLRQVIGFSAETQECSGDSVQSYYL